MTPEGSRWRKLAQPVPDHILGDKNGHMPPTIVHPDGETNHLGHNG
jgi:hypothetical protein